MSGKLVVADGGPNGPVNHLSIVSGKFRRLLKGTHTKSSASQPWWVGNLGMNWAIGLDSIDEVCCLTRFELF